MTESLRHSQHKEFQTMAQLIQKKTNAMTCEINRLPNELLLLILEKLDFEQLTEFAAAWLRISHIVRDFDIVSPRELHCFCLKQDYRYIKLGVGVSTDLGYIASEFDLLSQQAYDPWKIRRAINNLFLSPC
ncbi:hypothetical protein F4804DRAFT_286866 [Jackrogersella minutella]|nr:hypothetical protein F4804DRAFT_286866 [Jackrogersella minutella]